MQKTVIAASVAALFMATSVQAEETKSAITGSGEAGYTETAGNTESESLYAALNLEYTTDSFKAKGLFEATDKKENDVQTQERYVADLQLDRYFATMPQAFAFVQARYENDDIVQIDLNSTYVLGLGYEFFNTDKQLLSVEAGLGYQNNDYASKSAEEDFDQTTSKLAGKFEYQINDNMRFLQDVSLFSGEEQDNLESNTALKVKMSDALNMKASYKYRNNSNPGAGLKKDDTTTQITLVYDF